MEREPERNPETRADLNEAPQEELPTSGPLSPTGGEHTPPTPQPAVPLAADATAAQVRRSLVPDLDEALEDPEQFLGMLLLEDLCDREGHLLLAKGQTVSASDLAEIEAAGCLNELARIIRAPHPQIAPLGME
jgi:hypothetical protein